MTVYTGTDGLTYRVDGTKLTVSGTGNLTAMSNGKLNGEIQLKDTITELELQEGVGYIATYAFYGCGKLAGTVYFPSSVPTIYAGAFLSTKISGACFLGTSINLYNNCFGGGDGSTFDVYTSGWGDATTINTSAFYNKTAVFHNSVPVPYYRIGANGRRVQVDSAIRDEEGYRFKTKYAKKSELFSGSYNDLTDKPNLATVDAVPTASSNNLVKSGGVYSAIATAVSSVLRWKGTVSTLSDLPTSDRVVGDCYNVSTAGTATLDNVSITVNAGDNVAWNGTQWDVLAGTMDLSIYALASSVPDELADLTADSTHRTVTDTEKSTWNGKQDALSFMDVSISEVE